MRDVIPLARVPRAHYQRTPLLRGQLGRATAEACDGELVGTVRITARVPRLQGILGGRLRERWNACALRRWRGRIDGQETMRLTFYARERAEAAGEGVGLVRSERARLANVATGAHHGYAPVWTLYSAEGFPLLVIEGADHPAPWEAPSAALPRSLAAA